MDYKTTEAKRRANSKYRKANKDEEKIKSYRRTAKMYINRHAKLADILLFQKTMGERVKELAKNDPENADEIKELYRKSLREQEDKLKEE